MILHVVMDFNSYCLQETQLIVFRSTAVFSRYFVIWYIKKSNLLKHMNLVDSLSLLLNTSKREIPPQNLIGTGFSYLTL